MNDEEQQTKEIRSEIVLQIDEDGKFQMGGSLHSDVDFYAMLELAKEQVHHEKLIRMQRQAAKRAAQGGGEGTIERPSPQDIEDIERHRRE